MEGFDKKQIINTLLNNLKEQDKRVKQMFNITKKEDLLPLSKNHYLILEGKINCASPPTSKASKFSEIINKLVTSIIVEFQEIIISNRPEVSDVKNKKHLDEKFKDDKNFLFYIVENGKQVKLLFALSGFGKTGSEWCSVQSDECINKLESVMEKFTPCLHDYSVEGVFVPFSRNEDRSSRKNLDGTFKELYNIDKNNYVKAALIGRFFRDRESYFPLNFNGMNTLLNRTKNIPDFVADFHQALQVRNDLKKILAIDIVEKITLNALLDGCTDENTVFLLKQSNHFCLPEINEVKRYQEKESLKIIINKYEKSLKKVWANFSDINNSDIIEYGGRCSEDNLIDYLAHNADVFKSDGIHYIFNVKKGSIKVKKKDSVMFFEPSVLKIIPPCSYCILHFPLSLSIIMEGKAGFPLLKFRERINLPATVEMHPDLETCGELSYLYYSFVGEYFRKVLVQMSHSHLPKDFLTDLFMKAILYENEEDIIKVFFSKMKPSNDVLVGLLCLATQFGSTNTVAFLLKKGVPLSCVFDDGATLLQGAIWNGHFGTVKFLLDFAKKKRIDLIFKGDGYHFGLSPLHVASSYKRLEMLELLVNSIPEEKRLKAIRCKPEVNKDQDEKMSLDHCWEVFHRAIYLSNIKAIKYIWNLLKNGNVDRKSLFIKQDEGYHAYMTPLHIAAMRGDYEIFKYIYEIFPIEIIESDDYCQQIVKPEHGFKGGCTALNMAIDRGDKQIADFLLKKMIGHQSECLKRVIITGERPGETIYSRVLHSLSLYGFVDIMDKLLNNAGLDQEKRRNAVNSCTNDFVGTQNLRPLHIAAIHGHKNIVAYLLKNNADANAKAEKDLTPLHSAVQCGDREIVQLLLDNQADCNAITQRGMTPLHTAVSYGHMDIVKLLLRYGAIYNPKNPDKIKYTPCDYAKYLNQADLKVLFDSVDNLFYAVKEGNLAQVVKYLNEEKETVTAMVNARNDSSKTLLHLALLNSGNDENDRFVAIFHLLLKKGANVNTRGLDSDSLLHISVRNHKLWAVKLCLSNGAMYNMQNNKNETPAQLTSNPEIKNLFYLVQELFKIIKEGSHQQVFQHLDKEKEILLNARNKEGETVMHAALDQDHSSYGNFKILMEYGRKTLSTDKFEDYCKAMYIDCGRDISNKIIETLLDYAKQTLSPFKFNDFINAKTIKKGNTVLHAVSQRGNVDVVKLLLANGAMHDAKNKESKEPLELTDDVGIIDIFSKVKELFELIYQGKNATKASSNFIKALDKEHSAAIVNARDSNGYTPLCGAIVQRPDSVKPQVDSVEPLLKKGANPNFLTNDGTSPLRAAASYHIKAVKSLLGAHKIPVKYLCADPNLRDEYGCTSLHWAVYYFKDNICIIDLLLQKDADPNIKDDVGRTSLHWAILSFKGNMSIINRLLEKKADPSLATNDGYTCLHTAAYIKNSISQELVNLLIKNIAKERTRKKLVEFIKTKSKDGSTALDIAKMRKQDPDLNVDEKKNYKEVIAILSGY